MCNPRLAKDVWVAFESAVLRMKEEECRRRGVVMTVPNVARGAGLGEREGDSMEPVHATQLDEGCFGVS